MQKIRHLLLQEDFDDWFQDRWLKDQAETKRVSFEDRVVTIEYDVDSPANVNGQNEVSYESLDRPKNNLEKSTNQTAEKKKVYIYDGSKILSQLGINES